MAAIIAMQCAAMEFKFGVRHLCPHSFARYLTATSSISLKIGSPVYRGTFYRKFLSRWTWSVLRHRDNQHQVLVHFGCPQPLRRGSLPAHHSV